MPGEIIIEDKENQIKKLTSNENIFSGPVATQNKTLLQNNLERKIGDRGSDAARDAKGGQGGEPGAIGCDQLIIKNFFFDGTKSWKGEFDDTTFNRLHEIHKHSGIFNGVIQGYCDNYKRQFLFNYIFSPRPTHRKDESNYRQNPRRDERSRGQKAEDNENHVKSEINRKKATQKKNLANQATQLMQLHQNATALNQNHAWAKFDKRYDTRISKFKLEEDGYRAKIEQCEKGELAATQQIAVLSNQLQEVDKHVAQLELQHQQINFLIQNIHSDISKNEIIKLNQLNQAATVGSQKLAIQAEIECNKIDVNNEKALKNQFEQYRNTLKKILTLSEHWRSKDVEVAKDTRRILMDKINLLKKQYIKLSQQYDELTKGKQHSQRAQELLNLDQQLKQTKQAQKSLHKTEQLHILADFNKKQSSVVLKPFKSAAQIEIKQSSFITAAHLSPIKFNQEQPFIRLVDNTIELIKDEKSQQVIDFAFFNNIEQIFKVIKATSVATWSPALIRQVYEKISQAGKPNGWGTYLASMVPQSYAQYFSRFLWVVDPVRQIFQSLGKMNSYYYLWRGTNNDNPDIHNLANQKQTLTESDLYAFMLSILAGSIFYNKIQYLKQAGKYSAQEINNIMGKYEFCLQQIIATHAGKTFNEVVSKCEAFEKISLEQLDKCYLDEFNVLKQTATTGISSLITQSRKTIADDKENGFDISHCSLDSHYIGSELTVTETLMKNYNKKGSRDIESLSNITLVYLKQIEAINKGEIHPMGLLEGNVNHFICQLMNQINGWLKDSDCEHIWYNLPVLNQCLASLKEILIKTKIINTNDINELIKQLENNKINEEKCKLSFNRILNKYHTTDNQQKILLIQKLKNLRKQVYVENGNWKKTHEMYDNLEKNVSNNTLTLTDLLDVNVSNETVIASTQIVKPVTTLQTLIKDFISECQVANDFTNGGINISGEDSQILFTKFARQFHGINAEIFIMTLDKQAHQLKLILNNFSDLLINYQYSKENLLQLYNALQLIYEKVVDSKVSEYIRATVLLPIEALSSTFDKLFKSVIIQNCSDGDSTKISMINNETFLHSALNNYLQARLSIEQSLTPYQRFVYKKESLSVIYNIANDISQPDKSKKLQIILTNRQSVIPASFKTAEKFINEIIHISNVLNMPVSHAKDAQSEQYCLEKILFKMEALKVELMSFVEVDLGQFNLKIKSLILMFEKIMMEKYESPSAQFIKMLAWQYYHELLPLRDCIYLKSVAKKPIELIKKLNESYKYLRDLIKKSQVVENFSIDNMSMLSDQNKIEVEIDNFTKTIISEILQKAEISSVDWLAILKNTICHEYLKENNYYFLIKIYQLITVQEQFDLITEALTKCIEIYKNPHDKTVMLPDDFLQVSLNYMQKQLEQCRIWVINAYQKMPRCTELKDINNEINQIMQVWLSPLCMIPIEVRMVKLKTILNQVLPIKQLAEEVEHDSKKSPQGHVFSGVTNLLKSLKTDQLEVQLNSLRNALALVSPNGHATFNWISALQLARKKLNDLLISKNGDDIQFINMLPFLIKYVFTLLLFVNHQPEKIDTEINEIERNIIEIKKLFIQYTKNIKQPQAKTIQS